MTQHPNIHLLRTMLLGACLAIGLLAAPTVTADGVSIETEGDGVFDGVSVVGLRDALCTYLSDMGSNPLPPVCSFCGNGVVEEGEDCDGADLNGASCQGLNDPNLACSPACEFDTSACQVAAACQLITVDNTMISDIQMIGDSGSVDMTVNCPTPEVTLLDGDVSGTCCSWDAFNPGIARFLTQLPAPDPNHFFQLFNAQVFSSGTNQTPDQFSGYITHSGIEQSWPVVKDSALGFWYFDFPPDGLTLSESAELRFDTFAVLDWDVCEIQIEAQLCESM